MNKISFLCIHLLLMVSACLYAQETALAPEWISSSPFEHKVFVANKGQCDGLNERSGRVKANNEVVYSCRVGEIDVYFTRHGLTFRYDEPTYPEERREENEPEEDKRNSVAVPHFINMEWSGADPGTEVAGSDPVAWYFTYGDVRDRSGKSAFKAEAFEKITYKNIYQGIDIEYSFPKGKEGIKYAFIVHPGADPSLIKMSYSGLNSVGPDASGNLILNSSFGDFTDHAPVTYYSGEENNLISSSFVSSGNTAAFSLGKYDRTRTIVIDPWLVTPPAFSGNRKAAYDVEYDVHGNVYAYGGTKPFQVIKYNNVGVQQWVYTTVFLTDFYGDFAVDGYSGSAYIGEGYRQGATQIIKINSAGVQQGIYAGTPSMDEISRITFNNCTHKAVVAGGGVSGNCQAGVLDTTLAAFTPVNVLGASTPLHDFALLAIDNSNDCYMATLKSFAHPTVFDNKLVKCPAATLTPVSYMVSDNYQFLETASIKYTNAPFQPNGTNGFNGIAVSAKYVYTYDGQVIQRWNKLNGALINSATVTATPFLCGGITTDDCDNIFVGVEKSVVRYDTNFTVLSTNNFPDTVYDVRLALTNRIYACGKNFVSAFKIVVPMNNCNFSVTITPGGSCGSGTAVASASGGIPGYTYWWNPGGQTTSTVTGLTPGTYTVIVSDNSCIPKAVVDSIVISAATFSTSVTSAPATCANNNGTATVSVSIGTPPYTYAWSPSGGNSSAATGLSAGTYSVVVTDGTGCTSLNTVTISIPNAPLLTPSQANVSCNGGNNGGAAVAVSGGSAPYTYQWSPSGGNSSAATGLSAGNYTVTVTDANSCSQTQTVSITQPAAMTASVSSVNPSCANNNGTAAVSAAGGNAPFTYLWSNSQISSAATGLSSGTYSVLVTDANGCTASSSVLLTAPSAGTVSILSQTNVVCNGGNNGSVTVNATGGSSPYTYLWSNSQAGSSATGLSAGNYTVTVTDASGCISTQVVTITQPAAISVSATSSPTQCNASTGTATAIAAGGSSPYTYLWTPTAAATATATGLSAGNYFVLITDANGCTSSTSTTVNQTGGPTANAGANVNIIVGDSIGLNATGGVSYSWTPSATLSCVTCQNPVASPSVTTSYTVIVSDANGCTDADVVMVNVEPISCNNKLNAGNFYLPNAFSPNNDGENDELCLIGWDECLKEFTIRIYNRWGEVVFRSDEKNFCWDGTLRDRLLDTGAYAFYAHAILYNDEERNLKGSIALVR